MIKHLAKLIIIANVGFFSCNSEKSSSIIVSDSNSALEFDSLTVLAENIGLLGELNSFTFIDKDKIIVSSLNPSKVYLYSIDGKQIKEISNSGSGPNEFLEPTLVKSDKSNIYVWCRNQLKLTVFDFEGTPIKEYSGFKKAISDFVPYNDDIYFFITGGHSGPFIERFSLSENKITNVLGHATELHKLIGTMECSGGLASNENKLFFVSPDRLELNEVDLKDMSTSTIRLSDSEFYSPDFHQNAVTLMNEDRIKVLDILEKSSWVTGLFVVKNLRIIKTEVGEYDFHNRGTNRSPRSDKYYILNDKFQVIETMKSEKDFNTSNCLFSSTNEGLYSISVHPQDNDFYYQLNTLKLGG